MPHLLVALLVLASLSLLAQPAQATFPASPDAISKVELVPGRPGPASDADASFKEALDRLAKVREVVSPRSARIDRLRWQDEGLSHESRLFDSSKEEITDMADRLLAEARKAKERLVRELGGAGALKKDPEALHRFWSLGEWERKLAGYREATVAAHDRAGEGIALARKDLRRALLIAESDPEPPVPLRDATDLDPLDLPVPPAFTTPLDDEKRRQALEDLGKYEVAGGFAAGAQAGSLRGPGAARRPALLLQPAGRDESVPETHEVTRGAGHEQDKEQE